KSLMNLFFWVIQSVFVLVFKSKFFNSKSTTAGERISIERLRRKQIELLKKTSSLMISEILDVMHQTIPKLAMRKQKNTRNPVRVVLKNYPLPKPGKLTIKAEKILMK